MYNLNATYYIYHQNDVVMKIPPTIYGFYDLTIVLNGCLNYTVDGKNYAVAKNCCILIPSDSKKERKAGERAEYVSINFTSDDKIDFPVFLENCVNSKIKQLIYACNEFNFPYDPYSKEILENLTNAILTTILSIKSEMNYNKITKKILNYISNFYYDKLTLNSICEKINYSPTYCDEIFKKDINKSIISYLIDYRIEKAKELFFEHNYNLTQIANKVGFSDYNYFSRTFKKHTGYTPNQYKKIVL